MNKNRKKYGWILFVAIPAMILSGCGLGTPAEPTLDPNVVFTEVAETVMVSMTQTAAAIPPTPTPEPTSTPEPTRTPEPTPATSNAQQPAQPAAPAAPQQYLGDKAAWRSNNPSDNQTFTGGFKFQLTACFDNVGSTEWNDKYYLEYVSGENLWYAQSRWFIDAGKKVKPSERWCFTMHAVTPAEAGSYITRYFVRNPDGIIMEELYFPFKVAHQ